MRSIYFDRVSNQVPSCFSVFSVGGFVSDSEFSNRRSITRWPIFNSTVAVRVPRNTRLFRWISWNTISLTMFYNTISHFIRHALAPWTFRQVAQPANEFLSTLTPVVYFSEWRSNDGQQREHFARARHNKHSGTLYCCCSNGRKDACCRHVMRLNRQTSANVIMQFSRSDTRGLKWGYLADNNETGRTVSVIWGAVMF